jgi:arylsulfatase A-like enzyme
MIERRNKFTDPGELDQKSGPHKAPKNQTEGTMAGKRIIPLTTRERMIYGIVEACFSYILPWLIKPAYDYTPLHAGFTALLFVLYPIIGLILGGLCALSFKAAAGRIQLLVKVSSVTFFAALIISAIMLTGAAVSVVRWLGFGPVACIILGGIYGASLSAAAGRIHWRVKVKAGVVFPALATSTVMFTLAANFMILGTHGGKMSQILPPVAISLALVIIFGISVLSSLGYERFRFVTNPWTSSILLLGIPWTTSEFLANYSRTIKVAATMVFPTVIILTSFFLQKFMDSRRADEPHESGRTSLIRSMALIVPIALVLLGAGFFLRQSPQIQASAYEGLTAGPDRPNVLLITMDTVRADHMPLYGYERDTTPNIRKFSETATLYIHSIASGSMTLSTHASIFTGMYAERHHAHCSEDVPSGLPLADDFQTLAEVLSEKGYLTLGVAANYGYLSDVFGLDRGFQYFDNRVPVHFFSPTKPYYLRQTVRNFLTHFASPYDFGLVYRRAEEINQEVFKLLDRAKKEGRAFFLFVNYMDAHRPYIPPHPFDTLYPGKDASVNTFPNDNLTREVVTLGRKVTEREKNHLISQYDGGIAYIDSNIGVLLTRLKELGLYENTLIIMTSDHGEAFGEKNLMEHGISVYQDQVSVPLIVKFPHSSEGGVVEQPVDSVDLMPTVLDVLGYAVPGNIEGVSLLKLGPGINRDVFSESYPNTFLLSWDSRFHRVERAIFSGSYKFISSTKGKKELYDLSHDPNEKKNLYQGYPGVSEKLEKRLDHWVKSPGVESESASHAGPGEKALDRLKALGYIQ